MSIIYIWVEGTLATCLALKSFYKSSPVCRTKLRDHRNFVVFMRPTGARSSSQYLAISTSQKKLFRLLSNHLWQLRTSNSSFTSYLQQTKVGAMVLLATQKKLVIFLVYNSHKILKSYMSPSFGSAFSLYPYHPNADRLTTFVELVIFFWTHLVQKHITSSSVSSIFMPTYRHPSLSFFLQLNLYLRRLQSKTFHTIAILQDLYNL